MKQRIFSIALALCLCISNMPVSYASGDDSEEDIIEQGDITPSETPQQTENKPETSEQDETNQENLKQGEDSDEETKQPEESELDDPDPENPLPEKPEEGEDPFIDARNDEPVAHVDVSNLTQQGVYDTLIAFRDRDGYTEGTTWTDATHSYTWHGGPVAGNITSGTGCAAFAFQLSDAAFGDLRARTYTTGNFNISDVRPGDILRINNNSHSVIVLQVTASGVVIAEANYNKSVHWGRVLSKAEVEAASYFITRYPENYVDPDDETANEVKVSGEAGNLTWKLTNSGTLTISGSGAMPNYDSADATPWSAHMSEILNIVIDDGVTTIGNCAFYGSGALGMRIPDSVTAIGNSAFRESALISANIPGSVKSIGNDAFRACTSLVSADIEEGVEALGERAFRSCNALTSITLPASVTSVGSGAFMQCEKMTSAIFKSSGTSASVTLGDSLFMECWNLATVTLPQHINADGIGDNMFMNCLLLTNVTIPEGAESIGQNAFSSCGRLTWVSIPNSVKSIGIAAFSACNYLTDIYFGGTETQWGSVSKIGDTAATLAPKNIHYEEEAPHVHVWADTLSNDATSHWYECLASGCTVANLDKNGYGEHEYSEWYVDKDATDTEDGSQHRVCNVCGYTQTQILPAGGGNPIDPNPPENPDTPDNPDNPDTPDTPDTPSTPGNSGSNSGSSSSGGGTAIKPATPSTSTTENTDGSVTTVKTDERTGTVTETTTNPDGSKTVVATQTDGTVTTTETDSDGNRTETVDKPDGSSTIAVDQSDGTTASVTIDATGKVDAEVSLPSSVVNEAQQTGEAVPLPIPEVRAPKNTSSAPTVTVKTGSAGPVRVTIPVVDPVPGDVAILVRPDGSEEILKTSVPVPNGVTAALPDGATVKIVDNSKDFSDVTAQHWAADTIDFVSARELFTGTTPTTFTPDAPMTRAMLITVLARFDGADTAGGSTWYEKGVSWAVSKGVSDGSAPEQNITREQLIVMLWRYAGSPAAGNTLSGFTDAGKVSDYAQQAMSWAVENGIISGFADGTLGPNGEASRAQVAQILKNFIAQGV